MKTNYYFTLLLLLTFFTVNAQMSDLAKIMGDKELMSRSNIYNTDDSFYGLLLVYKGDKVDKKHRRYEYLILDKNLNKVAKKEFINYKNAVSFYASKIIDNKILLKITYNQIHNIEKAGLRLRTYRKIDLSNNTISKEFLFAENKPLLLDWNADKDVIERLITTPRLNSLIPIKTNSTLGFLAAEFSNVRTKKRIPDYQIHNIKFFDNDNNLVWTYSYNKNATKNAYSKWRNIYTFGDEVILKFYNENQKHVKGITIVGIDLKNGKQTFKYVLDNKNSELTHYVGEIEKYGDKIYITGLYYPKHDRYNFVKKLGLYRVTLDSLGKKISKKYIPWKTFSNQLEIDKYAKIDKGYRLDDINYFIFKDGSVSFLSEKFRAEQDLIFHTPSRTSDMVLMNMDKDFKAIDAITIKKSKSNNSYDYLFAQYIKDNTGCVFFYKNFKRDKEKKDKVGVLGINKYINSKYSYEEIPIYSKKNNYMIDPIPAKEGYILLREYNEDDKYDQLRLEKLNY